LKEIDISRQRCRVDCEWQGGKFLRLVWISFENSASGLLDLQKALSVLGLGSLIDLTEVDDSSVFLGGLSFKVFIHVTK
jgi:hypothetical protein